MNISIFTRLRWFYWRLPLYGRFAVLAVTGLMILRLLPASPGADTRPANLASYVDQTRYDAVAKWGQSKVDAAEKVMAAAQQDCVMYEEGSHLVVEMKMYIDDPDQRLQYIRAVADTDVILRGSPRNIYFYDPSNKKIGQVDTLNGVRLDE